MSAAPEPRASATWAVVLDRESGSAAGTLDAVAAQTRRADHVVVAGRDLRLRRIVEDALAASVRWIWLLDAGVLPRPGALAALLDVAEGWPDDRLRLLASRLVDQTGELISAQAPLPQALDPDLAAQAFEHHTCSIRIAGYGSLLVRADMAAQQPPPERGAGADLVWSAHLLAGGVGLLVPHSIVTANQTRGSRPRLGLLAGWLRLLAGDGLSPREKPWVGFIYFERAAALISEWARDRRSGGARPATPSR